jgi:hypothetical protein
MSDALIQNLTIAEPKPKTRTRNSKRSVNRQGHNVGGVSTEPAAGDAEELGEFIEVYPPLH